MRARPLQRPCPNGREQPLSTDTNESAWAPPTHVYPLSGRNQIRAKAKLSLGPSGFAPAAENQAAKGEAQAESANGETAYGQGLAPG